MSDLTIQIGTESTDVSVRLDSLRDVGRLLGAALAEDGRPQVVVVTDRHVGELYAKRVLSSLEAERFEVLDYRMEPGEASKDLRVAGDLYRFLADHAVGRDAVVLALGGGVVSDLAGFVAATWMRGIRFVVCPTTLEADIDASIGGKTAVNLPAGKNLVGAFHQPFLVIVDPTCLNTLDARDVRAGLAESVKHALIRSEPFLAWHEGNAEKILALDEDVVRSLILQNLAIKAKIVEEDALERTGARMLLNFGHTIGHAIESGCGFTLRHGECVALGMLAACRLSTRLGLLDGAVVTRVERLLSRLGLPTCLAHKIEPDRILDAVRIDKKVRRRAPTFVLLEGVSKTTLRNDVPDSHVREAYESLLA